MSNNDKHFVKLLTGLINPSIFVTISCNWPLTSHTQTSTCSMQNNF